MAQEDDERHALSDRIVDHLRRYGAESSRVVDVFAHRHGLHPTDLQALVIVLNAERQDEPATPMLLARALNLTSGAVTGVVDRLVRSGHIRREPDRADRRQTRLFYAESGMALAREFFGPLGARTDAVIAEHSLAELRLVESFLRAATTAMIEHRQTLQSGT